VFVFINVYAYSIIHIRIIYIYNIYILFPKWVPKMRSACMRQWWRPSRASPCPICFQATGWMEFGCICFTWTHIYGIYGPYTNRKIIDPMTWRMPCKSWPTSSGTSGILPWAEVKTTISWHVRGAPAARVSFHKTEAQNCVLQVGWAPAILVDWSLSFVFWS
jgi:hypothetical protein